MQNILKLTIITPEKQFYSGEVLDLVTENEYGRLGFLPEHIGGKEAFYRLVLLSV